jgi:hypothetical protein
VRCRQTDRMPRKPAAPSRGAPCPPAAALPAPFSYTHRPGRSGPRGPAGSGADFPVPRGSLVWGPAKNGLASSRPQAAAGSAPSALPDSQAPRSRLPAWGLPARPTLHLPCTSPGSPTLHLPYAYRPAPLPGRLPCTCPTPTDQHLSQVAYPAPALRLPTSTSPRSPTLHLPSLAY